MANIIETVLAVLSSTPQRWIQLAEALPPEIFHRRPASKEWSAHECLQHVMDTERTVFPIRVGYILRGEEFPAFYPDEEGMKPKGDLSSLVLAQEFSLLRTESIKTLKKVAPDQLKSRAKHQELGMVSLEEMINEWAGHDLIHTMQAERAIMQIFIAGCGPWSRYFGEHLIA
ncbi:MAG: DinB superfamily protein [Syntrophaceae bacterium PtaB.Bin095]|nr:MAG: DinB superfamily protein [Syntrophaceae bacterium PtaB.Bin095]